MTCAGPIDALVRLQHVDGLEEVKALRHARRAVVPRRVGAGAEDGAGQELVLVEEDVVLGRRPLAAAVDLLHRPSPPPLPQSRGAPHAVLDLRGWDGQIYFPFESPDRVAYNTAFSA